MDKKSITQKRIEEYLTELLDLVTDPIHKKLIEAYQQGTPVESMEEELSKILLEIANEN